MPHESVHDPSAPFDPLRDWYTNTIWGRRVDDDNTLFEVMSLQVFQAGLTWKMILDKRDGFRNACAEWNIDQVAAMGPQEVEALRQDGAIIRNRRGSSSTGCGNCSMGLGCPKSLTTSELAANGRCTPNCSIGWPLSSSKADGM